MNKKIGLIIVIGIFLLIQPLSAQTWEVTKRLTWNPGDSETPGLVIDSNNHIHVVWEDDTPGNREIYYKKSTNGGATWTTKRLTWNSEPSFYPAIAVDSSDTIHLVWEDDTPSDWEIYYKRSTDGGVSWSGTNRLTWSSGNSGRPAIAVDSSDTIHVVWGDNTPGYDEIFYKGSTDGGVSWSVAKRLTWSPGNSFYPAIAVDSSDTIHVVWESSTPGKWEIYYKRSTDGGVSWSGTNRLTYNSGLSGSLAIAVDSSDTIHVVWYDSTPGNFEIYYKKSMDEGVSWSGTKRLTWSSGTSSDPAITVDSSDTIHLVWNDYTPGNFEIYYKRSTDGGVSWSVANRLTYNSGMKHCPTIATDSSNAIHIVWSSRIDINWEICYKKGIQ